MELLSPAEVRYVHRAVRAKALEAIAVGNLPPGKELEAWILRDVQSVRSFLFTPEPPEGTKKSARFIFVRFLFLCSNAFPQKKSARFFFLLMNSASNPTLSGP